MAVGAIAYFLELEGIATTGISLVRENTESMKPPRFLWVPFPLGRPLGAPGDSSLQSEVVGAALALLEHPDGPVLVDFDIDEARLERDPELWWRYPGRFAPQYDADAKLKADDERTLVEGVISDGLGTPRQ